MFCKRLIKVIDLLPPAGSLFCRIELSVLERSLRATCGSRCRRRAELASGSHLVQDSVSDSLI